MGNQRLIQTQTAATDRKQHLDKRTKQPEHPMQEVLGSRAASRHFRAQLQRPQAEGTSGPSPLHSILQSISPVSPRVIQAKPMFRGLSHELTSALDSDGLVIQAKMTIQPPGDQYEQEADRVAEQVVQKMQAPSAPESILGEPLQHQKREEDSNTLRMKALAQHPPIGGMAATQDLESSINRARGGGQPLEAGLQRKLGQAMGADFSRVRVHTDHQADQLNRSIQAKAFTTGQDVFFRQGEYKPESSAGQKVLAHELTHVVQQQSGRVSRKKQIKEQVSDGGQVHGSSLSIQPSDGSNLVVQRDYVTSPYYGFIDLNKMFPGDAYQILTTAIINYRKSKKDQAALNLMVGAMNELPRTLPPKVLKEYEILSKEVGTEQFRINGVSPLPKPTTVPPKTEVTPPKPTTVPPKTEVTPSKPTTVLPKTEVTPSKPTSVPPKTEVTPSKPTSVPPKTEVTPSKPTSVPPKTEVTPSKPTTVPPKTEVTPSKPTSVPPKTEVTPSKPTTVPPKTEVTPSKPTTVPPKTEVTPSKPTTVPPKTEVTPSKPTTVPPKTEVTPSKPTSVPPKTEVTPSKPTTVPPKTEVTPSKPTTVPPKTEVTPSKPTTVPPKTEVTPSKPTTVPPKTEVTPSKPTSVPPKTEVTPSKPTSVPPKTEVTPSKPTSVSASPWSSAELRPDPKVLGEHQLKLTCLLRGGKTFYEFGSSERWESPKGGWAVEDLMPENRSTVLLKQGKVELSPVNFDQRKLSDLSKEKIDTNTYTIKETKETKVEFASDTLVQLNGKAGRIIIFSTQQGSYHWVSQNHIEHQEQKGYRFKYGDTTYWATQDSFTTEQVGGKYVDKTTIPLWTKQSPPNIEHIKQGSLGDCYLLATLASIMLKDPELPMKMMQDNQDGTVTVKLFNVQKASTPSGFTAAEKFVKVRKSVPEQEGKALYAKDHLWVQMIEKAYAAGGFTGNLLRTPSSTSETQYKDIGSGNEQHAFRVLLGQNATYKGLSKITGNEEKKDKLFLQIQTALQDKKPITLGTKKFGDLPSHKQGKATKGAGLAGEDILENVVLQHAYSVIRTEADQFSRYIIVRNPWGGGGGETVRKGGQQGEDKKGEIRISLGNLTSYFSNITIGPRTVSL
jgi:Domain of unknown function (DUF4157)/Calpain family cysteine protease